jgi:hypothetical protein
MTEYENKLKAFRFEAPSWVPCKVIITEQAWLAYSADDLMGLMLRHPAIFPDFDPEGIDISGMPSLPWRTAGRDYTDSWGARWRTLTDGMTGSVIHHPLSSWEKWPEFQAPDPDRENGWGPVDWKSLNLEVSRALHSGSIPPATELRHGHTFLTLEYLRGFENLIYDMHDEEPRLLDLIKMVEDFNFACLTHLMKTESDIVGFPEDLGAQSNSLISPQLFRKYIKPSYKRLMAIPGSAGKVVHMHCDGWMLNLADDLIECGVDVLNIQDMIHGIDELKTQLACRVALELDIDRQNITVFGNRSDIDGLIREEIEKLSDPTGGLALQFEVRPPVPLENVETICSAMEEYSGIMTA